VLRLANNLLRRPNKALHLDIARSGLILRQGEEISRQPLALKAGKLTDSDCAILAEAINGLLAGKNKGPIDITVSDAFCRCWILPRLPGLATPDELEALARLQLKSIFGDSEREAEEWVVRLDDKPFAQHWPVIALPRKLFEMCDGLATAHHLTLKSLQARFVRAGNRQARRRWSELVADKPLIQVLECSDSVSIGIRHGGDWLSLRVHPPLSRLGIPLPTLIKRDCLAAGLAFDACSLQQLEWPDGSSTPQQVVA
jgi:hypothetical protein